ncbi:MAG: DUF327 family protein [Cyanobacteria bacterium REEB65]|nr:DUF327 family protein [Cyanobacteria bacterium REEB65]
MNLKVGEGLTPEPGPSQIGPRAGQAAPDPVAFQEQLAYQSGQGEEPVNQLIGDVQEQAKRLLANPTLGELAVYRDYIRRFMKAIAPRLGKLEKHNDRRNRTLVLIRSVDEKLEALAQSLLEDQGKGIDLLAALNEIHGLLLDLLI